MAPGARCQRCEVLCHHAITGPGTLHLRFPLGHSLGKIRRVLQQSAWQYTDQGGVVSIHATEADLAPLVLPLAEKLSSVEQADTRAMFQPDGKEMGIADYLESCSFADFVARVQSGWLVEILREERLTTHFQPIVRSQNGEVYGYECLMRAVDGGRLVGPGALLGIARGADMLFQIDLAARATAMREAARHGIAAKIFINFNPTAIYDPDYCLRSTVKLIHELGIQNDQIVFEVVESDHVNDKRHLRNICDFYRKEGFLVALDDLGSGYSSLNMLHELRPDFIKLDMQLIRSIDQDQFKGLITRKLLEVARELEIQTIAEGIETPEEYAWLRQHGADLLQGYFIARPASPPPLVEDLTASWPSLEGTQVSSSAQGAA